MDKEIRRIAWSVLPKEFKDEVKRMWDNDEEPISPTAAYILTELFGIHNLTSDAEGEDEMLTVSRKRVRKAYKECDRYFCFEEMLEDLFGSKCLPDEVASKVASEPANNEPQPAEPKFHVGDFVILKPDDTFTKITDTAVDDWNERVYCVDVYPNSVYVSESMLEPYTGPLFKPGDIVCHKYSEDKIPFTVEKVLENGSVLLEKGAFSYPPTLLEPYTEPKNEDSATLRAESVRESRIASEETHLRNLSQSSPDCDKFPNRDLCDKLMRKGFEKHNRLHIASVLMAGLLANGKEKHPVRRALDLTDALMSECGKGESDGED